MYRIYVTFILSSSCNASRIFNYGGKLLTEEINILNICAYLKDTVWSSCTYNKRQTQSPSYQATTLLFYPALVSRVRYLHVHRCNSEVAAFTEWHILLRPYGTAEEQRCSAAPPNWTCSTTSRFRANGDCIRGNVSPLAVSVHYRKVLIIWNNGSGNSLWRLLSSDKQHLRWHLPVAWPCHCGHFVETTIDCSATQCLPQVEFPFMKLPIFKKNFIAVGDKTM